MEENIRLLICGDRKWKADWIIKRYLEKCIEANKIIECVIEGESRGAEKKSAKAAEELKIQVLKYKADWVQHGLEAESIHNQHMIDEGTPTHIIAFHNNIENSKNTKDVLRRGVMASIPCYLVKDCVNHFTCKYIESIDQINENSKEAW